MGKKALVSVDTRKVVDASMRGTAPAWGAQRLIVGRGARGPAASCCFWCGRREDDVSSGGGHRHIVNYGGDARRSGEHGHDNGRPAATPQAPGAAAPSGARTQGFWKPQRSYVIGVHSYLEAFGGAGVSWIGGRGDGLSR